MSNYPPVRSSLNVIEKEKFNEDKMLIEQDPFLLEE